MTLLAIGAVIVMAAQLLLIAGLLRQRARLRRAEATIRLSETTLRTSFEQIRQLAGRLINAQEAARAEVARDLHDDVCQELVGISMSVSSLKRSFGNIQDPYTQRTLLKLQQSALDVAEGVRRLSHELHPSTLQLLGLAAALKAHCIEVEKRHDVQVSFTARGELGDMQGEVALCLFRTAQEALRNGSVHGDARRLAVSVGREGEHIELIVTDDGRGFDLAAVRSDGSGLGLVSIEERVRAARGEVTIVTEPSKGTTIFVRVPAGIHVTAANGGSRAQGNMVGAQSRHRSTGRV